MKKGIFFFFGLMLTTVITAQMATQPKLTIVSGAFSDSYMIGSDKKSEKEINLHLKQTDTDAAYLWHRAMKQDVSGLIWSSVMLVGTVGTIASKNTGPALGWSLVAVTGGIGTLTCVIGSNSKKRRALIEYITVFLFQIYNLLDCAALKFAVFAF